MELIKKAREGNLRAIARLITLTENEAPEANDLLKELYPYTGNAVIVGITGPPGSGKSTLVDKLVKVLRQNNKKVGILAIDPTSPFTGGAILGDRVRMTDLSLDSGVYIRSLGTRGRLGGLSKAAGFAVKILDACGFDYVLIETVGVGQSEVDIMKAADTTVVVMVPGLGDDIQAIKAGILEIGDVFVVNKADRDGANRLVLELSMMLELNPEKTEWEYPILQTVATLNKGIVEVVEQINAHFQYLQKTGLLEKRRRERLESEILDMTVQKITKYVTMRISEGGRFAAEIDKVLVKEMDPYTLVHKIFKESLK